MKQALNAEVADAKAASAWLPRQGQGEALPFSYADLRERGLALVQALSGTLWTDFNHHDPGVTLLEALCFALTEGVFVAQTSIADLLTRQDGRIHYRRHGLHAAEEILPCRPTTEHDLLRWIYDRVPQIRHLRLTMQDDGGDTPSGVWQMALRAPTAQADAAISAALRAYWAQRNLCEDMPGLPRLLAPRWCRLQMEISIEGPRELVDILLELVRRSAEFIGGAPARQPLLARRRQRDVATDLPDPGETFDGPPLRNGWIATAELTPDPLNRLHFSDLARALQDIEGVAGIQSLSLSLETPDVSMADGALQWYDEDWALELQWPESADDMRDWRITRRGSPLSIDAAVLLRKLADDRQVARSVGGMQSAGAEAFAALPRPAGQPMETFAYYAAYNHLPSIYHGTEALQGSRAGGDDADQAQFIAYQSLLEQWLAHGEAQSQNLGQLYTIDATATQSYWWQMLDGSHLPGLGSLFVGGATGQSQSRAVFAAADDVLDRRSRVLDHLLALHGESCRYASMQAYGWYFSPQDWAAHLFACKRQWLLRIVNQTRNRGGGIDYSRPSLGRKGNTPAMQERIGLLLGLAHAHSRLLMEPLRRFGVGLAFGSTPGAVARAPGDVSALAMWSPLRARIAGQLDADITAQRVVARLGHYFPDVPWQALPAGLLRCATQPDHYGVSAASPAGPLWLGPDEDGHWWPLAVTPAPGGAEAAALYLHELLCRMQRECEGLHLVEHVLLRPVPLAATREKDNAPPVPECFYSYRMTVAFSGWTARGASQAFRDIAAETVALNCPAHIVAQVVWLDAQQLRSFESIYVDWLAARQAYCDSLCGGAPEEQEKVIRRLNEHAGTLSRWLMSTAQAAGGGS